jgi:hypothetical protein
MILANQAAAPSRRPAEQSEAPGSLSAISAVHRAFPAAIADLGC